MLILKIAEQIELLRAAEKWLLASVEAWAAGAEWREASDAEEHAAAVRRFRGSSLGSRYVSGEVKAEALASAMGQEMRRLAAAPTLLRFALGRARWPAEAAGEGASLLSKIEQIGG